MNLKINTNFLADTQNVSKQGAKNNSKSVYAGSLNLNNSNQMMNQKKELARKQAMRLVKDAFGRDEKKTNAIQGMRDDQTAMKAANHELKQKIAYIDETVAGLPEQYGVEKDGQEYKDYELLKKYQENKIGVLFGDFSDEEISRLKELQNIPLTDFQKQALSYNDSKISFEKSIQENNDTIKLLDYKITDAKIDLLKSSDVGEAKKVADSIIEAADKDAISIMFEEIKNHIDDKFEETKEKASEEKEIEEEKSPLHDDQEDEKEQEAIIEGQIAIERMQNNITNSESNTDNFEQVQTKIYHLMKENKMVNEDIKGIEIDLSF